MKQIDSYFNPLIVAKTIFNHASVFSESKNENERIYAQKLKAFINLAADELQVTGKDTDFSDRLYLRIMDLQIETFNKTVKVLDVDEIDKIKRDVVKTLHSKNIQPLPAIPASVVGFTAALFFTTMNLHEQFGIPVKLSELTRSIKRNALEMDKRYPKTTPLAKDTITAILAAWTQGDRAWGFHRACDKYASNMDSSVCYKGGNWIKTYGTDNFVSLVIQHLNDPHGTIEILAGEISDEGIRKHTRSIVSHYEEITDNKVRDSRDQPKMTDEGNWVVMRIINEVADRVNTMPADQFRNGDGLPVSVSQVNNFKQGVCRMQEEFNVNFVNQLPGYQQFWRSENNENEHSLAV